jgi:hypothetical protein
MAARSQTRTDFLPPLTVRQLVERLPDGHEAAPAFFDGDRDVPDEPPAGFDVLLPAADAEHARAWLARSAARVYLGEAALDDGALVERLGAEFTGRVGVYAPARRVEVSWNLEVDSNADFRVVTPSIGEPSWEVLTVDGRGTGTQLGWWLGEMFQRGAAGALVRADVNDDADLNILAALVEQYALGIWVGPLTQAEPDLEAWVTRAKVNRLVVPKALVEHHPFFAAFRRAPGPRRRRAVA